MDLTLSCNIHTLDKIKKVVNFSIIETFKAINIAIIKFENDKDLNFAFDIIVKNEL
ncbi:hypothetical protein [Clostridium sporogenes]|uniref:hypothetical protein n=1 Tax=Clostridium sporogenes TaxID=1509 RepID=UPI0013D4FBB6|nr:hypothetical protein [Clostridium sporogenes]